FAKGVDRVVRPKVDAIREILDQGDVEREVTQVIWGLNFPLSTVDVEQPAKRSHGKQSEKCGHHPEPEFSVAHCSLGRLCPRTTCFIRVRSSQPGSHGKGNAAYQRESRAQCIQAVADHSQKEAANNRQIDKG